MNVPGPLLGQPPGQPPTSWEDTCQSSAPQVRQQRPPPCPAVELPGEGAASAESSTLCAPGRAAPRPPHRAEGVPATQTSECGSPSPTDSHGGQETQEASVAQLCRPKALFIFRQMSLPLGVEVGLAAEGGERVRTDVAATPRPSKLLACRPRGEASRIQKMPLGVFISHFVSDHTQKRMPPKGHRVQ